MSNLGHQKLVSLVVLTSLGFVIGCGDGQRSHTQKIRRTPKTGFFKNNPMNNQAQTAGGPVKPLPNDAQIKNQSQRETQIQTAIDEQLKSSQQIRTTDLEDGTYTLETSTSNLRYRTTEGWAEGLLTTKFQLDEASGHLTPSVQDRPEAYGIMTNDFDLGREMEIPVRFVVENKNGQPWKPSRVESSVLFKTILAQNGSKLEEQDTIQRPSLSVPAKSALMDVLGGQTNDGTGKTLNLKVLKTQDGRIRFYITVDEKLTGGQNTKEASMTRNLIFTYRVDKKQTHAAPAQTTTPPPASEPVSQ